MFEMTTLIKNGRIITATDDYVADVFIDGETVAMIGKNLPVKADKTIDAKNKLVIPGAIDPHVHMELPFGGTVSSDDFKSGTIGAAFGGRVRRAKPGMHGKTSAIHHSGRGVFRGLPDPFTAIRYHSLAVERETLPGCLEVTAWTDDGEIMGLAHRTRPIYGVQFHPESIATQGGHQLLGNFLDLAGVRRLQPV